MTAVRHNSNKPDLLLWLDQMPNALAEVNRAKEFGSKKYDDPEKGIDGNTNWADSIGTIGHLDFQDGCRSAVFRHLMKIAWQGHRDTTQNSIQHMAFVALNALMWLEYELAEE